MKPQRKPHVKPLATALAATLQIAAIAAVPLAWDVRPGQPAPVTFDRYHGETIEFAATFRGFGELPFAGDADLRLWYQTNGMGTAWWSAPAAIQSNVITAVWSPEMDPGADRVSLFFGAPSNAYAAAVLRLRHSPGFRPANPPPPSTFTESDPVFTAWLADFSPTNHTHATLTDGTNIITAAREVYLAPRRYPDVVSLVGGGTFAYAGEERGEHRWGTDDEEYISYDPEDDEWIYFNNSAGAWGGTHKIGAGEQTVSLTNLFDSGSVVQIAFTISTNLVYVGRLALTNDIAAAMNDSISTNNQAFVSAVLAAPLVGASASDIAEIAEYGGYGTVGAALLALIAGLAAIKRRVAAAETSLADKADKATTLAGYGINDAKIQNGVITLGGQSITPLTSVPTATDSQLGVVKPDGTTITIADGVLSAVGGGGGGSSGYPVALWIHAVNWDNSQYVEANGVKYTNSIFTPYGDFWLFLFDVTTLRINFAGYGGASECKILAANGTDGIWRTVEQEGYVATIPLTSGAYVKIGFDSCLAPDTEIMLSDMSTKALEDIRVGDMIMSPHGPDRVVRVSRGKGSATDEWEFEDGTVVRTIGRHRFWNCELGEPLYLEAWNIGEHAKKPDGTTVALVSHRRIEGAAPHSTLFTEKWNLYYAGGLLAGNRHSVKGVGL